MFHKGTQLHTKEMSVLYFHQISNMTKLILFKVIFIRWFHGVFSILSKLSVDCDFSIPANIRLDEDVLKTSWRRLSSSSSKDVFKTSSRRLDQDEYVRLSLTSSEDVFKTSWSRPIYSSWPYVFKTSSRRFQDVFKTSSTPLPKTSSRHLQDTFKTFSRRLQDVFKTSSRRLANTSWRHLQDVLKTYHQVKLFLLTSFSEIFNMFVRRTAKTIVYRRIHLGHTSEKFMVTVQNLQEW